MRPARSTFKRKGFTRPYTHSVSSANPSDAVSIYVHVPFCTVRCSYCDFNTYANLESLIPRWESALLEELSCWAPAVAGRPVPTVFFGGGTPSLLDGQTIARVLDAIRRNYSLMPTAEISLEANPESVELDRLTAYRAAGVTRLSIGVQSLDQTELRFLDRLHDAARAARAVQSARAVAFDSISLDLIFGLPEQSLVSWRRSLEGALALAPDHLSCYALTIEEGTPLAARVDAGQVREADQDVVAEMADWTEDRLAAAGYTQYEISNFARLGHACRQNLAYWQHHEYVGVGPGAHGFVDGVRYAVERSPSRYIAAMAKPRESTLPSPAIVSDESIDDATVALDTITLGLRLNAGVDVETFATQHVAMWERFQPALEWATAAELLIHDAGRLRLTRKGRRLANEVFVRLMEPSLTAATSASATPSKKI